MTRSDFNDLVHQLNRKLYVYAFRFLQNQEEAEDAVQEVFIKLWRMGEKLNEYTSVDALATTMTKNYCIDQLRRRKTISYEDTVRQGYHNVTSPSPQDELENTESYDIILRIIDHLPESYQMMIRLRDMDGFSYEEIAEKTDQNINTLRVVLSRARKIIREEYNKFNYERRRIKQVD